MRWMSERLAIDATKIRKTREGFLVANPRIARTGIQDYRGSELGLDGDSADKVIRVYRPEAVVLADETMRTFTNMTVTLNHPPEAVDAENWKDYSVGDTGEDVAEDAQSATDKKKGLKYLRVPMMVRDQDTVNLVEKKGIRELSVGYQMALDWTPGETETGEAYDASVTKIIGNHLAIVPNARGGSQLRIGDGQEDAMNDMVPLVVDGITVQVTQKDKQILDKHLQALQEAADTATAKVTELEGQITAKDTEIAMLTKKVEDAALTPEQINALVKDHSEMKEVARFVFGEDREYSTVEEMRREIVTKTVGDAAKGMDDSQIKIAYDTVQLMLSKDEGFKKRQTLDSKAKDVKDNVHSLFRRPADGGQPAKDNRGTETSADDRLLAAMDSDVSDFANPLSRFQSA